MLVVDDDQILEQAFARLQTRDDHPYCYKVVASCRGAVSTIRDGGQRPILVLCDYVLGDGFGTDLVPIARDLPVVIMTGHGSERVAVEALRAGASDYLIKDHAGAFLELVAPTVERVLGRRSAETTATERTAELAQSRRDNRALEQFASLIANALSTPLQMVSHYCGLMHSHATGVNDRLALSYAAAASAGARRAVELMQDVTEYARLAAGGGRGVDVDAAACLHEAIGDLRHRIDATGTRLVVGDLPRVTGDPPQLRALWHRLLRRAIDRRRPGDSRIEVDAVRSNGVWEFTVRDHGAPAGGSDRATSSDGPEPSLDMAICRRIVERHGGSIRVELAASGASTVRFALPAAPPS